MPCLIFIFLLSYVTELKAFSLIFGGANNRIKNSSIEWHGLNSATQKGEGGLGFRDMASFNRALVAKGGEFFLILTLYWQRC